MHLRTFILTFFSFLFYLNGFAQSPEPINLGNKVNSVFDEIAPVISPDEQTIYFSRRGHPGNLGTNKAHYDIWFAQKDSTGKWKKAENIGPPLNNNIDNFISSISPDGNSIVVNGYYDKGVHVKSGFSVCRRTKDGWSKAQGLDIRDFDKLIRLSKFTNIWLGSDGKTMVLSLGKDPNEENSDLYVSFLGPNNIWSRPRPLGNQLNTKYDESTPFLAADGITLYFSSNRPNGLGNNDIYVTKRLDEDWTEWTKPELLTAPINSEDWDAYYTVPASGKFAYMLSYRSGPDSDIYKVELKKKFQPDPVVLVYGTVYDAKTKEVIGANITYEYLDDGNEVGRARSNPADGSYKIVLKQGKKYGFQAEVDGYFPISQNLDLDEVGLYREVNKDLYLVPLEKGETILLNNIFFDYAKASLRSTSFADLNRLRDLLKKNTAMKIEIQGHTDALGGDEANLKLSLERAKSCADYLIDQGISTSQVSFKGLGETKPIADNATEEGRQKNRRVTFQILEK